MNGILKGIDTNLRLRRLAAFLIDLAAVAVILTVLYTFAGIPDFPLVASEMKRVNMAADSASAQAIAGNMLTWFNTAYLQALFVWFCYEVLTQLIFGGSTPGKLILRLQLVPYGIRRGRMAESLLMVLRSFVKFLMMYLFQGFPFLLSVLYLFADEQSRTGYDRVARLVVTDRINEGLIENA